MKKLNLILASITCFGLIFIPKLGDANQQNKAKEPSSFLDWCRQKSQQPLETQLTIQLLLKSAKEQDCAKAHKKLHSRTELSLSNENENLS
ncbi:hypothetical protein [Calothrix sp. PCC 6303]|uniref:hypothetical protein n=1 Tax=Calothrix sp. PCC 6303 TaxID=1170562 RepID=UPI0002E3BD36|nr:hypothetical protein [Calothrix sp. PCC 6303]